MAATTLPSGEPAPEDTSLYPIAVLIDELKNEDVQVCSLMFTKYIGIQIMKSNRI